MHHFFTNLAICKQKAKDSQNSDLELDPEEV